MNQLVEIMGKSIEGRGDYVNYLASFGHRPSNADNLVSKLLSYVCDQVFRFSFVECGNRFS